MKNVKLRDTIHSKSKFKFFSVKFIIVELFKHKNKILQYTSLSDDELLTLYHHTLNRIHFIDDNVISDENLELAYNLCKDIDEKDTLFVALTLELNGQLWTGDKELKKGLKNKGFDLFFEID